MLTRDQFQSIYDQGPDATFALVLSLQSASVAHQKEIRSLQEKIVDLFQQLVAQGEQIAALSQRVKELEDRLGKDSHNSSKPPSSDGFNKKPRSQRTRTGRPSGGQKGHPGHTLEFDDQPNEIVMHAPSWCQGCGVSLEDAPEAGFERRQVFDLPPISLFVTEHRALSHTCPACGQENRASFPEGVEQPVQYGPRVHALVTYLSSFQLLPYGRTVTLLSDLFNIHLSEGSISNFTQRAASHLVDVEKAIYQALCHADTVHFDETGVRIAGKLNWLHVSSTPEQTFYAHHPKRGGSALDDIGILPQFGGRAIHDEWNAYHRYGCRHGLCNAHHLRELTAVEEQLSQPWAKDMRELLVEIKRAVDSARDRGVRQIHPLALCRYEARYRKILSAGYAASPPPEATGRRGRPKQGPARNLLLRLDQRQAEVLAFMYDFGVPFDNNLAERDLRMMKVKQKVSGCFRSEEGGKAFCRIRGYISTMRKQGHNVLSALQSVFENRPLVPRTA